MSDRLQAKASVQVANGTLRAIREQIRKLRRAERETVLYRESWRRYDALAKRYPHKASE